MVGVPVPRATITERTYLEKLSNLSDRDNGMTLSLHLGGFPGFS